METLISIETHLFQQRGVSESIRKVKLPHHRLKADLSSKGEQNSEQVTNLPNILTNAMFAVPAQPLKDQLKKG